MSKYGRQATVTAKIATWEAAMNESSAEGNSRPLTGLSGAESGENSFPGLDGQRRAWSPEALGTWLLGRAADPSTAEELEVYRDLEEKASIRAAVLRDLPFDADPHRLDQSGWGVVWTSSGAARLRPLLEPLLARRQQQAGSRYKEIVYAGRRESAAILLARYGETLGILRPQSVPYYLLIVGGPEEIPFEVQFHLSINHAVGRLAFARDAAYAAYAAHVCAAERGEALTERTVGVFSVENDRATRHFGDRLITPLVEALEGYRDDWQTLQHRQQAATCANLKKLLSRRPPSLLIVSSHGRRLPPESEDQEARQGAIVCVPEGPPPVAAKDHELSGRHLPAAPAVRGGVCFLFSCYAAGTPVFDSYPFQAKAPAGKSAANRQVLARRPFIASVPQSLLSQGTLGVVGHVDRSWNLSFAWAEFHRHGQKTSVIELDASATLENSIKMLLMGERLGHALRGVHRRFAFLSGRLAELFHRLVLLAGRHSTADLKRLGYLWTGVNDARNLILLGDPAVYLRGQRSTPDQPVRLPNDLMLAVERTADAQGMSGERWIENLIRSHLPIDDNHRSD